MTPEPLPALGSFLVLRKSRTKETANVGFDQDEPVVSELPEAFDSDDNEGPIGSVSVGASGIDTGELATAEQIAELLSYRTQAELTGPFWSDFATKHLGRPIKVSERRFTAVEVRKLIEEIQKVA